MERLHKSPLGARIANARLIMGFTINQAARHWGFRQGALINWEYGDTIPREPNRTKLQTILQQIENDQSTTAHGTCAETLNIP